MQHEAPVAELVAEALDHERDVGRHRTGRLLLLGDVRHEVAHGPFVQPGPFDPTLCLGGLGGEQATERPDRLTELGGPAESVTLPERHSPGLSERG